VGDADGSDVPPVPAGGVDGVPTDSGPNPAEPLPPAGEGSDLTVDTPVDPDDEDAPRRTA
jgi:hypothetical protein